MERQKTVYINRAPSSRHGLDRFGHRLRAAAAAQGHQCRSLPAGAHQHGDALAAGAFRL